MGKLEFRILLGTCVFTGVCSRDHTAQVKFFGKVAGGEMWFGLCTRSIDRTQGGWFSLAQFLGITTAWVKIATVWRVGRISDLACESNPLLFVAQARIMDRHG